MANEPRPPTNPPPGTDAPDAASTVREPRSPAVASICAEVITRLGDRTLDVRHLAVDAEPAIPAATWTAIGACTLVLGLGLSLASISTAKPAPIADELAEYAEPAPARGGPGLGLGALLILLGIVPIVVGAASKPVPRDRYIVGEGPDVHLPFPMPPGCERAGVPMVRALDRQIVLGLFPGLTGELRDGPRTLALADLVAQGRSSYALPAGATCDAILGDLRIHVQAVEAAAFTPTRRPVDRLYLASNLGALTLLGLAFMLGEPTTTAELELEERIASQDLAVRYLRELPPAPPPPNDLPPAPKDRPVSASKPATRPPPPPSGPPPPTVDTLAVETAVAAKHMPKGTRRGRPSEYDFARTAGFLDEDFVQASQEFAASAHEGLLKYDNEEDQKMWAAVLAAPVIDRPFGGLELAETERGGGLHDDRPRPAKAPARKVAIDMYARKPPPSAEAVALARRMVSIEFEAPHVIGELSSETVLQHLQKKTGELGRCFKEQVGTADRVGTIILRLKLNGDGTMKSSGIDWSGAQLGDIKPCLTRAANAWKFTPPTDRKPASIAVEAAFSAKSY